MTQALATDNLEQKRWWIAIAAFIIQLCLGTIYAWSVVKNELVANQGWAEVPTSVTFMIAIAVIGLAAAFGGNLVDTKGARLVATLGGILFGVGTIIAGIGIYLKSFFVLYFGYGVIAGLGNGFGYVTPIATLIRWFPDKRGLMTGIAVTGFGLGAFFIGLVAPYSINNFGIINTFYIWGATYLVLIVACAQFFNEPPEGWLPSGYTPAVNSEDDGANDFGFSEALKTKQWWLLWAMLFLNVTASMGFISQLTSIAKNIYPVANDLSKEAATIARDTAGAYVVAISSIFNGVGRLFWSWLSDGIGRKLTFSVMFLTQAVLYLIAGHVSSYIFFICIACYLLSCLGGGFATMPAFTADSFGSKNIGKIYGMMLTAWSTAGIVGPFIFAWIQKQTGSYNQALYVATALLVSGFILSRLYHQPRKS